MTCVTNKHGYKKPTIMVSGYVKYRKKKVEAKKRKEKLCSFTGVFNDGEKSISKL